MSAKDLTGRTLGYRVCPECGFDKVPVRVNKSGHLYAYCPKPVDGGCGVGPQSRDDAGDTLIAKSIRKWNKTEDRKRFAAAAGLPAGDDDGPPDPAPAADPEPPPPVRAEPKKPWWDKEL